MRRERVNGTDHQLNFSSDACNGSLILIVNVIYRPVSEIQNEIEGLQCFITEAENKLGTEEINFEKQYWDKKSAHHNFVKLFKELTDLHAVCRYHVCMLHE